MIDPNGRQTDYQYNSALDSAISRPDAVADDSAPTLPLATTCANSLIEQDTATAVDSGGVLPTSHFLQYALDPSFNDTGELVTANSGSYDSVAIQNNGESIVAGVTGSNLTITRYAVSGTLDPTFGTAGVVTISESSPTFAKLALDSSGNIDVAVNSGSNVKVYQLSSSGSTNWSKTLTFATGVVPQGIALEPSGHIVVAGDSSGGAGIYLAGLNPSTGAIDTGFGSSGYVNAPLSGNPSGLSVALDSSGKILVAGSDSGDFAVVRFTSSGGLDTSFNSSGEVTVNLGGTDTAYAVAPGPAGTIVAAGVSVQSGNNDDALIRLTSAGALDTSFNSTGKIVGSSGSGTIRAILVQTNGEVLAGGDASSGTAQKVWMFTPAGAADTAFASGGTLTANSGATVYGWAVASGPTQRIVVAGSYGGYEAMAAFAPASVRLYAQQNANYNVTAMVDPYGNVVQRYAYDSYGNMTVLSATWTPQSDLFNTQVGFQGMWLDQASGLYHTPSRDYSSALGRWMQADPARYVNGPDTYQLEAGDPASLQDPTGLYIRICAGALKQVTEYLTQNHVTGWRSQVDGRDALIGMAVVYDKSSLMSEILGTMIACSEPFNIAGGSPEECAKNLVRHVNTRVGTVVAARSEKFGFSGGDVSANPTYWHVVTHDDGDQSISPNSGADFQDALLDLWANPSAYSIGCAQAATLVEAEGALGQGSSLEFTGMDPTSWVPGDWGFVRNDGAAESSAYDGENIIYAGNNSWWGHLTSTGPTYHPLTGGANSWVGVVSGWSGGLGATVSGWRRYPSVGLRPHNKK